MTQKSYYLDTNIWLNLFKTEGDASKGKPYWKIAKDFLERVEDQNQVVYVSTIVLKELTFKLDDKLDYVLKLFKKSGFIKIIKTVNEDYDFARDLETKTEFKIGFYDYLHIAISKRMNSILITRDKDLIDMSKDHVKVHKPEDLLS